MASAQAEACATSAVPTCSSKSFEECSFHVPVRSLDHRLAQIVGTALGEGLEEEGEHAVASYAGKGGEFEGVRAARQLAAAGFGPVAAEGAQHLAGELGKHARVVLAVDPEAIAAGPLAP